eukprot:scaffold114670_cov24-Attheya_sp.AAC.1
MSGSASLGSNPSSRIFPEMWALHAAPEVLSPYRARTRTILVPARLTNSFPAVNQIFSRQGAFRYELPTSATRTLRLFRAAIMNAIHTESRATTDE